MRILLLGGGGFISSAVERRLEAAGHALTALNRSGRKISERTRSVAGDRNDPAALRELASGGFDAVVDFLCYDSDQATIAVEAFKGRTGRFVMISTGSVYWCTGDWVNPVGEDQYERPAVVEIPATPLTTGSVEFVYGLGKRAAEDVFARAAERGDLPSVRLRFPVVGGPGDPTGRYAGYWDRVTDGAPVLLPDGGFNSFRHIFVDDAAAAVESALTRPGAAGGYNVASREILSVRDLVALMARLAGLSEPEVIPAPVILLERWRFTDLFAPFSSPRNQILDPARAVEDLGVALTPCAAWVAKTRGEAGKPPRSPRVRWRSRAEERELAGRLSALVAAA